MNKPELRGLYAITPDSPRAEKLLADVEAALNGGCRIVQFRDKTSNAPERVSRARALRDLTRRFGATLLINDDLALACLIDADGVHLGKDDGNLLAARHILGGDRIIGASCYDDLAKARLASQAGVDYVAFGAAYPSPTKPDAPQAAPGLYFRAKSGLTVATCAIGGITLANAPPLIDAGADMLAVITDLFSAPDIALRAAAFQRLFEESPA